MVLGVISTQNSPVLAKKLFWQIFFENFFFSKLSLVHLLQDDTKILVVAQPLLNLWPSKDPRYPKMAKIGNPRKSQNMGPRSKKFGTA